MTDTEALERVLAALGGAQGSMALVRKQGRVLLALPGERGSALRTLRLYQPQRPAAKAWVGLLKLAVFGGVHRALLPAISRTGGSDAVEPALPKIAGDSLGILLGSPEHRVRRAITCFRTATGWQVAKVALGPEGRAVIEGEAGALTSLPPGTFGAPPVLGVHHGVGVSILRMPHFSGRVLRIGDSAAAIALLGAWVSGAAPRPIQEFAEWRYIVAALSSYEGGAEAIESLNRLRLCSAVRHGDFARWNLLRQEGGGLMAIDWEWGVADGMPGIDLVHFFAQDERLVRRRAPSEVIGGVEQALRRPECGEYLKRTGWGEDVRAVITASIAFTVGAKQQANEEVLAAVLRRK